MEITIIKNQHDEKLREELPVHAPNKYFGNKNRGELKETNDCVVTAIAEAFGSSYQQAHGFVKKEFGRKDKKATPNTEQTINGLIAANRSFMGKKFAKLDKKHYRTNWAGTERKMTLEVFQRTHRKGTYLILVRKHALVVKDGVIIDHTYKPLRRIEVAYLIKSK